MSVALLLGAAVYVAVGLALPLGIGAHGLLLIVLNVNGALYGWLITILWLVPTLQSANRRHLLRWTSDLRLLSAQEFEWLVGEVLRREGWNVHETGREGAGDGNVSTCASAATGSNDLSSANAGSHGLSELTRYECWQAR